jgi:hypothetical protein
VLVVHRSHRLASRASVDVDDLAGERVAALPGLPPETALAIVPAQTPNGARLERHEHAPATIVELMAMVGRGEIVHLTSEGLLSHLTHPEVVQVRVEGLPRSRTALAWVRERADPRRDAFVAIAREVVAGSP